MPGASGMGAAVTPAVTTSGNQHHRQPAQGVNNQRVPNQPVFRHLGAAVYGVPRGGCKFIGYHAKHLVNQEAGQGAGGAAGGPHLLLALTMLLAL